MRRDAFIDLRILVFSALLIALAGAALPFFVKARTTRGKNACEEYVMWVEAAKQVWATENKKRGSEVPTDAELAACMRRVRANINAQGLARRPLPFDANGKLDLQCPVGGYLNLGTASKRAHCSTTQWNEEYFNERYYNIIAEISRKR